jgi:nicotinate-nucleotide adenylyltransferase
LQELHLWKDIARLAKLCTFATIARPGFKSEHPLNAKLDRATIRQIQRHIIHAHACDIASRDIRARVARGLSIRYLVPDAVRDYILRHELYR